MRNPTCDERPSLDRSRRHALDRILVTATAGRPVAASERRLLAAVSGAEIDHLLTAASRHGVTGFVGHTLLPLPELAPALRERLTSARNRVVRDHLRAVSELPVIAEALDAAGIPWLTFKGPVLAELAYDPSHLREYVDIDVLVPATQLPAALRRLDAVGYRVVGPGWSALARERAGEVALMSPSGVLLDLHWELLNDWRTRAAFSVPTATQLVGRARRVVVGGTGVPTLDPVDTLLHLALHAGTSGGWRLAWLEDLARARRAPGAAGPALPTRAREWQAGLLVASMLVRSARVLGHALPPHEVRALTPARSWLQLLAAVDRVAPVEQATGHGSLTRLTTNATQRDTPTSVGALVRRSAAYVQHLVTERR